MTTYAPGNPTTFEFDLRDDDGSFVEPLSVRVRLLDENETVLSDWQAGLIPNPYAGYLSVQTLGALNILTPPATRGARTLELEATMPAGIQLRSKTIVIAAASSLVVGHNTFLTHAQADLTALDFASSTIQGWTRATERAERESALIEAYSGIMRMPLVVRREVDNIQSYLEPYSVETGWLSSVKQEEFLTVVPAKMLAALRRAQLLEAATILDADPVTMARRNGLVSMTVGESSQFFGASKPLQMPVASAQAMEMLAPWIRHTTRLARG